MKRNFAERRRKAIERVRARGGDESKVCKTASEFLDRLADLFAETDPNESTEDLKKRLEEEGIDTDKAVARVKALIKKHLEEK